MSLKLCCALPVTLNCIRHARLMFITPESSQLTRRYFKPTTVIPCSWFSTNANQTPSTQKNPIKRIYSGVLAPHMKAVKVIRVMTIPSSCSFGCFQVFSLSSSIVGIVMQPILYKEIVSTGSVPIILAAYSFIGFFTVVTPFLLHMISRKYVTELSYNEDTETYTAKTLNFFCIVKQVRVDDLTQRAPIL